MLGNQIHSSVIGIGGQVGILRRRNCWISCDEWCEATRLEIAARAVGDAAAQRFAANIEQNGQGGGAVEIRAVGGETIKLECFYASVLLDLTTDRTFVSPQDRTTRIEGVKNADDIISARRKSPRVRRIAGEEVSHCTIE